MTYTPHTGHTAAAPEARRPAMSPGVVLLRGLVASGGAVLAALVITPAIRDMLNVNAFQDTTSVNGGFPSSGALSAGVCIATLLAVLVLQLLQRVSPRPFAAFTVVLALGYLAFLGVSVTSGLTASQISGQLVVCLALAVVIAAVASWATGVHPDFP